MVTKPKTNTERILEKIDGEIETAKGWEDHINKRRNNRQSKRKQGFMVLALELEYWLGGRKRLEDVKQWILSNIEEV